MSCPATSTRRHVNARDVLPPALLEAVQKALDGRAVALWVPSQRPRQARDRAARIAALRSQGMSTLDIARSCGVSRRRVQQVLAAQRVRSER